MAAAFKALNQAVIDASAIIRACSWYTQASGSTFVRAPQVPPNAVSNGIATVDLTQAKQDPNGSLFSTDQGAESIPFILVNHKFTGATQAIVTQAAATAIEADIAAAILVAAVKGEVPGPRVRVLIGRDTAVTKPTIQFQLSISWVVLLAKDAGPAGHFA